MVRTCKRCHTEKEVTEFPRHCRKPEGYDIYCKKCIQKMMVELRQKDIEVAREKERLRASRWVSNPENRAKKSARDKEWRKHNKHIVNYHTTKRKTDKKNRMPKWLTKEDKDMIQEVYLLATALTRMTGIEWHVDHIIPLRGKKVSGLHVPYNLQVIPREENIRKYNKYEIK